ncbi:MAG: acyl-CoA dehydratase activase [Candidatus Thermoplasmatota archaeon]|nr:acyl-CoA dehydratase activase [Candidatus Thermoplasmatota archaeon]
MIRIGLDIGSTTAKLVAMDPSGSIVHSDYRRHNAAIDETLREMLSGISFAEKEKLSVAITGSAGLGLSERCSIPFVQEVIAAAETIRRLHPSARTLIDVGGEDSKMIFFDDRMRVDIRMNGNCAGGTGAFIDQMATLLNVPIQDLDAMARKAKEVHKIASRCGVFAKTDVQNLISRKIPSEEIAASVFHAVALQTVSTLSRGCDPRPAVIFCGGPFTFLPFLKVSFMEVLGLEEKDVLEVKDSALLPAIGTALYEGTQRLETDLETLLDMLSTPVGEGDRNRLVPLFDSDERMREWLDSRMTPVEYAHGSDVQGGCFLGIDSGSTTTKVVLIDDKGRLVFSHYSGNKGDPIEAVRKGLGELRKKVPDVRILRCVSTGYGEELIQAAFGMDLGIVETLAHFRAASEFLPDVSFVLDIGGQDMKAMFIRGGIINDIELNEACSSGCGSFLETFANNLGLDVEDFANMAVASKSPYDLGTRCTVFMNSKVKQALREGASVSDISAGLAVSVVKNCLYKVLKIKDPQVLGDNIVIQGGTFRNPAVHRALEMVLGKRVICPSIPELMGAYGAALSARDGHEEGVATSFIGLEEEVTFTRRFLHCSGCQNTCTVTRMEFGNGNVFFTGNRCERIFSNKGGSSRKGRNLADEKIELLFKRRLEPEGISRGSIGIPRVLNMYENFPFWSTLFVEAGFKVIVSLPSTHTMAEKGLKNVMSENICYPAKLVGGHVLELVEIGVDRVFYPVVVFESQEYADTLNTFNCPIVTGYPDVVRSSLDIESKYGVPFDQPTISFREQRLLKKGVRRYLKGLGVPPSVVDRALSKALDEQERYKDEIRRRCAEIVEASDLVVMLAGRPYHVDHLISHKITEMISRMGADVITEDSVPELDGLGDVHVLTQWQYPNRIYNAVKWAALKDNVEVVQLNSFGCGPDALVCDESRAILAAAGKNHTLIRIDEVSSPGSMRLRLRSMMESLSARGSTRMEGLPRKSTPPFLEKDKERRIIVPFFSRFFSPLVEASFGSVGYEVETLPESDRDSIEAGLKYCNNEICYPAIVVIGDLIKALQRNGYEHDRIALGITQTGGQCRASSYLSLLKKAMVAAGFSDIPVVTVSLSSQKLNEQPGVRLNVWKLLRELVHGILFSDSLMLMYNSTAVREIEKGSADGIVDRYLKMGCDLMMNGREGEMLPLLAKAVDEFNEVEVDDRNRPVIGIVGEIYVKYNPFGNFYVVDHLAKSGIEPYVPPILDFFAQELVNHRFHAEASTKGRTMKYFMSYPAEWYVNHHIERYDRVRKGYVRYRRTHGIQELSNRARGVVSLVDQFGEGWLIPAEIASFAEEGINNVLCLQPFGCISNHIIGKGIENALKRAHPDLNVLYLDMDAGSSEVNIYNRLNFMMRSAWEDLERGG